MKFSSKLALVAVASVMSLSAFADDATIPALLDQDSMKASINTDMSITVGDAGGAYIWQTGTDGSSAVIIQENAAGGNWAYVTQSAGTAEAMIMQAGSGNTAIISQK